MGQSLLATSDGTPTENRSVLIADDDITNRAILRSMLQRDGYVVIEASDGREAVGLFEQHLPDIVLMDVMMPNMDGYEATRRIIQTKGDHVVSVIFLTGMTDDQALAQCLECGGDAFLTKPYSRAMLKAHLDAIARNRRTSLPASEPAEEVPRS